MHTSNPYLALLVTSIEEGVSVMIQVKDSGFRLVARFGYDRKTDI